MTQTNEQREKLQALFVAMVNVLDLVLQEVKARQPVTNSAPSVPSPPPPPKPDRDERDSGPYRT